MGLPALEKTWVHNPNWMFLLDHSSGSEDLGQRNMFLAFHYFLLDKCMGDWGGTFSIPVAGTVRYTKAIANGDVVQWDGPWTEFRFQKFIATDVGRQVHVNGAPAAGNNGYFTITAVDPSGQWVEYLNGTGVAQTHTGHFNVLRGSWPGLPNNRTPWRVYECNSTTHTGNTTGDRIDRYQTLSDFVSATSSNRSTVIYENSITGEQFAMYMFRSAGGDYRSGFIYLAPNGGLVMPATISNGAGPTHPNGMNAVTGQSGAVNWWSNTNQWWGGASFGLVNQEVFWNMQMTIDGTETHVFCMSQGVPLISFFSRRPADVPDQTDGVVWSGSRQMQNWVNYNAAANGLDFPFYQNWFTRFMGVLFTDHLTTHSGSAGPGPHYCSFHGGAEMFVSSFNGANSILKNDVLGEFPFYPISVMASGHTQVRGRFGRFPDWYYTPFYYNMPLVQGSTFPDDGSRLWLKIYNTIIPWNGTRLKLNTGD